MISLACNYFLLLKANVQNVMQSIGGLLINVQDAALAKPYIALFVALLFALMVRMILNFENYSHVNNIQANISVDNVLESVYYFAHFF